MKKVCMTPPESCVVIEMENGVRIGYRKAVLLSEINALGSLTKAAKVAKIDLHHARELVWEMNRDFSQPLVDFYGNALKADRVELTDNGMRTVKSYWQRFEPIWYSIIEERSRHY